MITATVMDILAINRTITNIGTCINVILIIAAVCIAAAFYKEKGELKRWRNVWAVPKWQTIAYVALAIALIVSIWVLPDYRYANVFMIMLIMINSLVNDVRYYKYAVRFQMDDLESVKELASKYPEARPLINKKRVIKAGVKANEASKK